MSIKNKRNRASAVAALCKLDQLFLMSLLLVHTSERSEEFSNHTQCIQNVNRTSARTSYAEKQ
jgi:hypothetical protein